MSHFNFRKDPISKERPMLRSQGLDFNTAHDRHQNEGLSVGWAGGVLLELRLRIPGSDGGEESLVLRPPAPGIIQGTEPAG